MQIILNSMHKYQPRFHVVLENSERSPTSLMPEVNKEQVKTFIFQETQFMAVTAYQNHMVSTKTVGNTCGDEMALVLSC